MRHVCLFVLFVTATLACAGVASSATIDVRGGNVSLLVEFATAGQDPDPVVDQATAKLKYRRDASDPPQKITVETNVGNPIFTLSVEAFNVRNGISTGEVILDTSPQDLITSISKNGARVCGLRYKLTALASQGTGMDVHTVTYTIMAD